MSLTKRAVSIHKLPEQISPANRMELLRRLTLALENGHARFVLDCSGLSTLGPEEIDLMLCCLEEAMKYKGDVRLAHLNPSARAELRSFGASRLFEIFDTSENAVSSYAVRSTPMPASAPAAHITDPGTGYAA